MSEQQSNLPAEQPENREEPQTSSETISSDDLFHGTREIRIRHAGEVYRLRLTRNGKLILHK